MNQCTECGSMAINLNMDGRDYSNPHLCDVCHWRAKVSAAQDALEDCIPALEIGLDAVRVISTIGDDRTATVRNALAKARAALAEVPK